VAIEDQVQINDLRDVAPHDADMIKAPNWRTLGSGERAFNKLLEQTCVAAQDWGQALYLLPRRRNIEKAREALGRGFTVCESPLDATEELTPRFSRVLGPGVRVVDWLSDVTRRHRKGNVLKFIGKAKFWALRSNLKHRSTLDSHLLDKVFALECELEGSEYLSRRSTTDCANAFDLAVWQSCEHIAARERRQLPTDVDALRSAVSWGVAFFCFGERDHLAILRPTTIHTDKAGKFHRLDGPAIRWGRVRYWFHHGVNVPRKWVESPHEVEMAMPANAELRRVFFELVGWDAVVKRHGAKTVAKDDFGKLVDVDLKDDREWLESDDGPWSRPTRAARFCDVNCPSTGRRYFIRVPPETPTCVAGLAWSAGMTVEEYCFAVET
jgi:hypothetical protein